MTVETFKDGENREAWLPTNLTLEIPFYFCQSSQPQQVIEIGPVQVNGTEKRFHPSMEGEVTSHCTKA